MAKVGKPWEKYAAAQATGRPWEKYAASSAAPDNVTSGDLPDTGDVTSGPLPDTNPQMTSSHGPTRFTTPEVTMARGALQVPPIDPLTGRQQMRGRTMSEEETANYRTGALVVTGGMLGAGVALPAAVAHWVGLLSRVSPATAYVANTLTAAAGAGAGAAGGSLLGSGAQQLESGSLRN